MPFLQVLNLSKAYPAQEQNAVDNVSFGLKRGAVLSVVGENGSGKTTLLKLISGLLDADKGTVYIENQEITGPAHNLVPGHKEIKLLAQNLNLMPKHTVLENIGYDLRRFVQDYQDERIAGLIQLLRLEGLEEKLPGQLSGGQQQRAALAKALAEQAPVLLLDEPFSNLDIMLKDEVKDKVILKAREDGVTLIFVTHDVKDALSLSDTIAVMREGKIIQMGSPQTVYEKPANEYVAYLFGSVNILSVRQLFTIFPELKELKKFSGLGSNRKLCFRPEHVAICREENRMGAGTVIKVAYMGENRELQIRMGKVVLRIKSRKKYAVGDTVYVKLRLPKIHLFD